ncbi:MAG: gamma-glutamylcyclotransferase [Rariglobus sp.]|nr:gamma-glutamylcyclotransferase family protein [Rariglobus sp.]
MTRLFVYGTLKRGCKNHHHIAGQTYVGDARSIAGYRLYNLGDYPGMVTDATDTAGVTGEIWSVDDAAIAHLDDFEGVDEGLYRRELICLLPPFDQIETHTYLYNRDPGTRALGPTWTE